MAKTGAKKKTGPSTAGATSQKTNQKNKDAVRNSTLSSGALEPEVLLQETNQVDTSKALTLQDPVARYMAEIRKYPLLDREEERQLAIQYYETGDPELAEKLVTSNLRFVVKIAAEYTRFGARLIDLIQEGNVGLMHAVREFNPYKGVKLITYAVWWIRGYIQDFLMRQYSMVRIGTTQNQRKLFYQLQKHREELEKLGLESGVAQLSGRLDIPEGEVSDMAQRMSGRDVSLDQPIGDEQRTTLMDLQTEDDPIDVEDVLGWAQEVQRLETELDDLRPQLNDREIFLLDHRILAETPLTLQEVGDQYGITREAVRQMETRLLKKIREVMQTPPAKTSDTQKDGN